jgi:YVTN family beta-propeller protein
VALIVLLAGSSSGAAAVVPNSVAVLDPRSGRVVADIQVGNGPSVITSGLGSVWVLNERDQTISQIDSGKRRLVRTFSVGGIPGMIAVADGALWVLDADSGKLLRLDPEGVVDQRLPLTEPNIFRLAKNSGLEIHGAVWLSSGYDNRLTRYGPSSNVRKSIFVGADGSNISSVGTGAGFVWVADGGTNELWQIDPVRAVAVRAIRVGNDPLGVAVGNGSVWVANGRDGTVSRIDPVEGAATATIHVGQTPAKIAIADGLVWVAVD